MALLLAVVAGFVLADDYGMSVDEAANADVGAAALEVYRGEGAEYFSRGEVLAHHGPSYFMLFSITSRLLAAIVPGWVAADGRHLTNFFACLLSGAALFMLCRRWLRPPLAWLTVALFLSQPLLFGYGFVNHVSGLGSGGVRGKLPWVGEGGKRLGVSAQQIFRERGEGGGFASERSQRGEGLLGQPRGDPAGSLQANMEG